MASLTPEAIEKAVNGKRAILEPWTRQTRHDTAVGPRKDDPPRLPAWTEPFDLWKAVAR